MQSPKLTISIVSANRPDKLNLCLKRLSCLPGIDLVKVQLLDNSEYGYNSNMINSHNIPNLTYFDITKSVYPELSQHQRFILSRNLAVKYCDTEYFTMLDDDDYYGVDAIFRMLEDIHNFVGQVDMIHYNCIKEGRFHTVSVAQEYLAISSNILKCSLLNKFNNYISDRESKIYLWNCGIVFKTNLLRDLEWKYYGCDDILPITAAYLKAEYIVKVKYPLYYYPQQSTICDAEVKKDVTDLEDKMILSYRELLATFVEPSQRLVLERAIDNSINQITHIDKVTPTRLIELYNEHYK